MKLLNMQIRKIVIRHSFDLDVIEENRISVCRIQKFNMKCEIERMEINYTFYFFYFCLLRKVIKND